MKDLLKATPNIWRRIALMAVTVLFLVLGIISVRRAIKESNDFNNFYYAAERVWNERALYDSRGVKRYPPTFQVLLAPLGAFSIGVAGAIWAALALAALAAMPRAFQRLSGIPPSEQVLPWVAAIPFIADNITLGQSGPVLVYLTTMGLVWAREGYSIPGGSLFAVTALLKVIPGAFIAIPIVLKRARNIIIGFVLGGAAVVIATVLVIGPTETASVTVRWLKELSTSQSPWAMVESGRSLRYNNQGLAITIARTISDISPHEPKGAVHLLSLPRFVAWSIYGVIAAAIAVVWFACARRARALSTPRAWLAMYSLTAIGMLAASSLVWTHYFIWLLPGFIYIADRRRILVAGGAASAVALGIVYARGLGFHMFLALLLFALIAHDFLTTPPVGAET